MRNGDSKSGRKAGEAAAQPGDAGVARVFAQLGLEDFPYFSASDEQASSEARANWPLVELVSQMLEGSARPARTVRTVQPAGANPIVAAPARPQRVVEAEAVVEAPPAAAWPMRLAGGSERATAPQSAGGAPQPRTQAQRVPAVREARGVPERLRPSAPAVAQEPRTRLWERVLSGSKDEAASRGPKVWRVSSSAPPTQPRRPVRAPAEKPARDEGGASGATPPRGRGRSRRSYRRAW